MSGKPSGKPPKKGPNSDGVSYTDYGRSGVTYKDEKGNIVSKEEMYNQPESMGGDKKPKAVRPIAKPNQKIEGEKPIAKPGKKPIAERLFDAPVESILEESTRKAIGKKSGGFMSCPHRPDGVRGVGAAIKGTKFSGLK